MKRKDKSSSTAQDRERNDAMNKSDDRSEKNLPGEYDAREDIMNRRDAGRVSVDVENFSRNLGVENNLQPSEPLVSSPEDIQNEPALRENQDPESPQASEMERPVPRDLKVDEGEPPGETDVTDEDLQALGPRDLSMDMGEDEALLKNRVWPVDMAGEDLDIPGAELDDEQESIGNEDEENNSYSLGGDRHEDDMEGK